MDDALIAQGKNVSDPNLRFVLASRIFASTVPPNRKDRRLQDASGLMVVMHGHHITDAASYAEAVKKVSARFYDLRSKHKKNEDLSLELSARINAFEDEKKYRKAYNVWRVLSGSKADAFEREHEFELRKYREAAQALQRWKAAGEKNDCKGWQKALTFLNKERFMLDYALREEREEIRRLEIVKRELLQEKKHKQMGNDER